jgi:hypothetical protein
VSEGAKGSSQTTTAVLWVIGVLALYVGTWPIIQLWADRDWAMSDVAVYGHGRTVKPGWKFTWTRRVYYPLNRLQSIRVFSPAEPDSIVNLFGSNPYKPLWKYYDWWSKEWNKRGLYGPAAPTPTSFP